jgi:hypothetical protein
MTIETLARSAQNVRTFERRLFGCSRLGVLLYIVFSLTLATVCYLRPLPTFDRYLYAGAVASLRYSDPGAIHQVARAEFDATPNPFQFDSVASEPYFVDVYASSQHFAQQMGLFRVKLGYVAAGYVLWRAGLPVLVGLRLISAGCLFSVALALLVWSRSALLSSVLLLTPPILNMGRMVTADPLSTLMIFLALFALAYRKTQLSIFLLIASIWVRPDDFILVLILLAWMAWQRQCYPISGGASALVALVSTIFVNRFAGLYGWRVLMQHGFVKPEVAPLTHPVAINFSGYLHALAGLRAIPYTFMAVFSFISAVAWKRLPRESIFYRLLPVIAACVLIRLLIFPNFDDRYFVWAYLFGAVALMDATCFRSSALGEDARSDGL